MKHIRTFLSSSSRSNKNFDNDTMTGKVAGVGARAHELQHTLCFYDVMTKYTEIKTTGILLNDLYLVHTHTHLNSL